MLQPSEHFKWLGCYVNAQGAAKNHVQGRAATALASWQILCKDFKLRRYSFKTKRRLYQSIIMPNLTHGVHAFPYTSNDLAVLEQVQNQIQRTFISVKSYTGVHERWIHVRSALRYLREKGTMPHCALHIQQRLASMKWSARTCEILQQCLLESHRGHGACEEKAR